MTKKYEEFKKLHKELLIALVSGPSYTNETRYDDIVQEAANLAKNFISWHEFPEEIDLEEAI